MRACALITATLTLVTLVHAEAPVYSAESLVNAADNQPGILAPNAIATLYGKNLAYTTRALLPGDIRSGNLPTVLPGTGVRVLVGGLAANIYYVSPTQLNFLIPPNLIPGTVNLQIAIDGLAGPAVSVQLAPAAPALFQLDQWYAVATHLDGSVITSDAPARPGEFVVLYANGLGQTLPPIVYSELPTTAAPLKQIADFRVLLDGAAVDSTAIAYAGVAPGFAGLYQINLRLPQSTASNPEIRIALGDAVSKSGLRLQVSPVVLTGSAWYALK